MKKEFSLLILALTCCMPVFSQKIFLTGDSHVSAKVYPQEVKKIIEKNRSGSTVDYWGKGGAGFYTFNENPSYMEHIFNAAPEVLVVHLGTNGCYNVPLDPDKTLSDITIFYENIRKKLPDCKIVFVTPFYNKNREILSSKGKEKKYGPWKVNEKTRGVSDIIVDFAKYKPNTFVIDNNADAGTVFLDKPGLIRDDNIHLTVKGYELLGKQVSEKLLKLLEDSKTQ